MLKLSLYQAIHKDPDKSPSRGPASGSQIGLAGASQYEAARRGPFINGPLNRAEYLRHHLPLIDQQRIRSVSQSSVRIRAHDCRLSGPVQPEPFLAVSPAGSRLAAGTGAYYQDGRVIVQKLAKQRVDETRQVLWHEKS